MEESNPTSRMHLGSGEMLDEILDRLARKTAAMVVERLEGKVLLRPRLLNYKQAAKYLGFDPTGKVDPASPLRQRKQKGQLPDNCSFYFGGTLVWDAEALDKWIGAEVKAHQPRSRRSSKKNARQTLTPTSGEEIKQAASSGQKRQKKIS